MAFMALETPLDTRLPVGPLGRDAATPHPEEARRGPRSSPQAAPKHRPQAAPKHRASLAFARQVSSMLWTLLFWATTTNRTVLSDGFGPAAGLTGPSDPATPLLPGRSAVGRTPGRLDPEPPPPQLASALHAHPPTHNPRPTAHVPSAGSATFKHMLTDLGLLQDVAMARQASGCG